MYFYLKYIEAKGLVWFGLVLEYSSSCFVFVTWNDFKSEDLHIKKPEAFSPCAVRSKGSISTWGG